MPGRILALCVVICFGLANGCLTPPKSDSDILSSSKGSVNSPGSTNSEDEEWTKLGREMRGDQPVQQSQTWDPLRDIMVSPRAQSIERSLGVDN